MQQPLRNMLLVLMPLLLTSALRVDAATHGSSSGSTGSHFAGNSHHYESSSSGGGGGGVSRSSVGAAALYCFSEDEEREERILRALERIAGLFSASGNTSGGGTSSSSSWSEPEEAEALDENDNNQNSNQDDPAVSRQQRRNEEFAGTGTVADVVVSGNQAHPLPIIDRNTESSPPLQQPPLDITRTAPLTKHTQDDAAPPPTLYHQRVWKTTPSRPKHDTTTAAASTSSPLGAGTEGRLPPATAETATSGAPPRLQQQQQQQQQDHHHRHHNLGSTSVAAARKIDASSNKEQPSRSSVNQQQQQSPAAPAPQPPPTTSTSSTTTTPWVRQFLARCPRDALLPVPRDYCADNFNLCLLPPVIEQIAEAAAKKDPTATLRRSSSSRKPFPLYRQALKLLVQDEAPTNRVSPAVEQAATALYLLLHQRYIMSPRGLDAVRRRFLHGATTASNSGNSNNVDPIFGRCPRAACRGRPLLPIGDSDDFFFVEEESDGDDSEEEEDASLPRRLVQEAHRRAKRYCAGCRQVSLHWDSRVDGCAWGASFCHLFLLVHGEDVFAAWKNDTPTNTPEPQHKPTIFGFRLHPSASQ